MINQERVRRHDRQNWWHTLWLILAMVLLLALLGYLFAGTCGLGAAIVLGGVSLLIGQQVSPQMILTMYKARPLSPSQAPALTQVMQELARRARLSRAPQLYYIPSQMMNAFAVGSPNNAIIGVTDGLLRGLTMRELVGVLAHEVSHVQNNDMRVMRIADTVSRLTGLFSTVGQLLLLLNLPLVLMGGYAISWFGILLLIFAPTLVGLLQLALSRTREYDADLDAVQLTGDPRGLASALQKLETYQSNLLKRVLLPGHRVPDPSLFRTHPHTEDRIARLLDLAETPEAYLPHGLETPPITSHFAPVDRRPRYRITSGLWY